MNTSWEGRFWLALVLILSLISILAFFTENEQLLLEEIEFLAESTIKGIEFLSERANPQFKAWLPRAKDLKRALFLKENDIFDQKDAPSSTFKFLLQEKDKITGLLKCWDWDGDDVQALPPLSTQLLPAVYEYAEAIKTSSLTSSMTTQFKRISEKAEKEKQNNLTLYKHIIVSWFDKILARHEATIRKDADLISDRLKYLQTVLKRDIINDQSLEQLVKKKTECLEDLLTSWSKRLVAAYLHSKDNLDLLTLVSDEKEEDSISKSPSQSIGDKFYYFNQFKAIFKEIEKIEF